MTATLPSKIGTGAAWLRLASTRARRSRLRYDNARDLIDVTRYDWVTNLENVCEEQEQEETSEHDERRTGEFKNVIETVRPTMICSRSNFDDGWEGDVDGGAFGEQESCISDASSFSMLSSLPSVRSLVETEYNHGDEGSLPSCSSSSWNIISSHSDVFESRQFGAAVTTERQVIESSAPSSYLNAAKKALIAEKSFSQPTGKLHVTTCHLNKLAPRIEIQRQQENCYGQNYQDEEYYEQNGLIFDDIFLFEGSKFGRGGKVDLQFRGKVPSPRPATNNKNKRNNRGSRGCRGSKERRHFLMP